MIVFSESIYHYKCDRCTKWWTIADISPIAGDNCYCPHCGHKNKIERISESRIKPAIKDSTVKNYSDSGIVVKVNSKKSREYYPTFRTDAD